MVGTGGSGFIMTGKWCGVPFAHTLQPLTGTIHKRKSNIFCSFWGQANKRKSNMFCPFGVKLNPPDSEKCICIHIYIYYIYVLFANPCIYFLPIRVDVDQPRSSSEGMIIGQAPKE